MPLGTSEPGRGTEHQLSREQQVNRALLNQKVSKQGWYSNILGTLGAICSSLPLRPRQNRRNKDCFKLCFVFSTHQLKIHREKPFPLNASGECMNLQKVSCSCRSLSSSYINKPSNARGTACPRCTPLIWPLGKSQIKQAAPAARPQCQLTPAPWDQLSQKKSEEPHLGAWYKERSTAQEEKHRSYESDFFRLSTIFYF